MPPKNDTRAMIFCRLTAEERSQYVLVTEDDCRQTTTNTPEASHHPETGIVDSSIVVGGDSHCTWADALGSRAPRRAVVPAPKARQQREFNFEAKTTDTGRHPSKKSFVQEPVVETSLDKKPINTENAERDTPEIVYVFTNRPRTPPLHSSFPTTTCISASQQQTTDVFNDKDSLKANLSPSSNPPRLLSDLPGWPKHRQGGNKLESTLREQEAMAERAVEIYMAREEARSADSLKSKNHRPSSTLPRLLSDLSGWPKHREGGSELESTLREQEAMAERAMEIYMAREEARSDGRTA